MKSLFSWIGVTLLLVTHMEFGSSLTLPAQNNVDEPTDATPEVVVYSYGDDFEYGEPTEAYLKELQEQLYEKEKMKHDNDLIRVTRSHYHNAINHGDTIGLQLLCRRNWLGCSGNRCRTATCPKVYFDEWDRCYGEVFQIYRFSGPGPIRVGDYVGIYYPHQEGNWLGCALSDYCAKATCPGLPTTADGFANEDQWFRCWGEVFKIYSRNKPIGETVTAGDDVALYHNYFQQWLSNADGTTHRAGCPGTTRPPSADTYENCWNETFTIWKR